MTRLVVTREHLAALLDEHPTLSCWGYSRTAGDWRSIGRGVQRPQGQEWERARVSLLEEVEAVQRCVDWLTSVPWTEAVYSRSPSSYRLKHVVENIHHDQGDPHYIPNGAMIAAALLCGTPIKLDDHNPGIGVSTQFNHSHR